MYTLSIHIILEYFFKKTFGIETLEKRGKMGGGCLTNGLNMLIFLFYLVGKWELTLVSGRNYMCM